jgi:hypothetical protein
MPKQSRSNCNSPRAFAAVCAFLATIESFAGVAAPAQCEEAVFQSSHPVGGDSFGGAMDMKGDVAIVGFRKNTTNGPESGSAIIYRYDKSSGWQQEAELFPSVPAANAGFGVRVAIDGDVAAVVSGQNGRYYWGTVWIFKRDAQSATWVEVTKIAGPDGAYGDYFGYWIDLSSERLMVNATSPFIDGYGAVYIYHHNSVSGLWPLEQALYDPNPAISFGISAVLSGDSLAIAVTPPCLSMDDFHCQPSEVRLYHFDQISGTWTMTDTVTDGISDSVFGCTMSLHDNLLVVGSNGPTNPTRLTVYVYRKNATSLSWVLEAILPASHQSVNTVWLTRWVAANENMIAVGDISDQTVAGHTGSVFIYRFDPNLRAWSEVGTLRSTQPVVQQFGLGVDLDLGRVIVGAPAVNATAGSHPGSIHFFNLIGEDCNINNVCDSTDIAMGTSVDANQDGIPDECEKEPCPADVDHNGTINVNDLLSVISSWGNCPPTPPCPADISPVGGDGIVNVNDLLGVISHWGPCP